MNCYNKNCEWNDTNHDSCCRDDLLDDIFFCSDFIAKNGLLPCPFCDSEAEINEFLNRPNMYSVECKNCNSTQGLFDEESEAIEAWNKRV